MHSTGTRAPSSCIASYSGTISHQSRTARSARSIASRRLGGRKRLAHLEGERRAQRGILREQLVQDRRAGARQARDEDRRGDGRGLDRRLALAGVDHAQPVREPLDQIGARERATDVVELRLRLERAQEDAQRLAEVGVAEIGEAGRAAPLRSRARSRRARPTPDRRPRSARAPTRVAVPAARSPSRARRYPKRSNVSRAVGSRSPRAARPRCRATGATQAPERSAA